MIAIVKAKIKSLHEQNPMLGHRGVRLGITTPEIYQMQVRAIARAAVAAKNQGIEVRPEIMIPLISSELELEFILGKLMPVIEEEMAKSKEEIKYLMGSMIELPAACIQAGELTAVQYNAKPIVAFFSFGTNDLTQTAFGWSRDDGNKFMPVYIDHQIFEIDVFQRLHPTVAKLMKLAIDAARAVNPKIKLGICGEHGGEPVSVASCHSLGLDYVSCSGPRVPVAIMAAAHANLK
jgi:pyruvate,orthophosphate dikinase